MSQIFINDYLKQLDIIKKVSGSSRETIVREAFKDLLKHWGKQHDLIFLAEYPVKTATKTSINVDGALLHELRMACNPKPCCGPMSRPAALRWTVKPRCAVFRPRPGLTSSATAAPSTGCWISTRKRNPKTPPSARSSTPTVLPITRKKSSTCWRA